jgi:hypothetical protein
MIGNRYRLLTSRKSLLLTVLSKNLNGNGSAAM